MTDEGAWSDAFPLRASRSRPKSFGDEIAPLLSLILETTGAERAFLVAERASGQLRVITSRDIDGRTISDGESELSTFAWSRANEESALKVFEDTRHDRRFRTEAERRRNARTRSIAVCALTATAKPEPKLYLDSRFRQIELPTDDPRFAAALRVLSVTYDLDQTKRVQKRLEKQLQSKLDEPAAPAFEPPAVPRPRPQVQPSEERLTDFHGFVTQSPRLLRKISEVRRIARDELPVLIEGESGVGKEVLARAIHDESGRDGRFVSVHCGSLADSLVEVELFGHAEGAFTGAEQARSGLIEAARGGTLFLDDIGDMSEGLQNALLRVLETRRYRPVRGVEEEDADIRVIASSLIESGGNRTAERIRKDLFFRLAGLHVVIDPLRERTEDIPLYVEKFTNSKGESAIAVDPAIEASWGRYDWPGNVRELENAIRRAIALGLETLTIDEFPRWAEQLGNEELEAAESHGIRSVVDRAEREVLVRTLEECGGNKSLTAKRLGLSRKTLYRRLHKYGIAL